MMKYTDAQVEQTVNILLNGGGGCYANGYGLWVSLFSK